LEDNLVKAIQEANGMSNAHRLAVGQQLKIPKKA
jgi:nucleoid-associated protein YgaU